MNYYNEIKNELINNEVYKKVKDYSKNRSDLMTYYNIGKLLSKAGKNYGEGIIKSYSNKLTMELGKGYNTSSLKRMRQFYIMVQKGATVWHQLSWSHYKILITLDSIDKINYYAKISSDNLYSVRQLQERIKSKEYERLDDKTKAMLIKKEEPKAEDLIKNPILIKNKFDTNNITEKMLGQLILEQLPAFLKELGAYFCFIENEYKIKIGDRYYYIDFLLFNYIDNCFVVLELKTTELKKEHFVQIKTYMNYIDKNVKTPDQNPTLGIILCKKDNKFIFEYVTGDNVIDREYALV